MDCVRAIAAGEGHSLIVEADGTLWGAGHNNNSQLGDDSTRNHSKPIRILDSVQAVAAGSGHSMMLKTDGSLWMVGFDGGGQLGDGGNINRKTPFPLDRKSTRLNSSH